VPRVENDDSPYVPFSAAAATPAITRAPLRQRGRRGRWNDLTGWQMHNARLPARIPEADSETPYLTDRAIAFIAERGESPWCLHLSYIKPHWPYMAPAPYNDLYGPKTSSQ